jgi:hypothetical protein
MTQATAHTPALKPSSIRHSLWKLWLKFRSYLQRTLGARTTAHVFVWLFFGFLLGLVPFLWANKSSLFDKATPWGEILHPPEVLLLAIALAAGACSELIVRTLLVEEIKFEVGAKFAYPATVLAIVFGLGLYGELSKPGSAVSRAGNLWCWGALVVAAILAIITITVNERSEHFIFTDGVQRREDLEQLRKESDQLRKESDQLRKELEQLREEKDHPKGLEQLREEMPTLRKESDQLREELFGIVRIVQYLVDGQADGPASQSRGLTAQGADRSPGLFNPRNPFHA